MAIVKKLTKAEMEEKKKGIYKQLTEKKTKTIKQIADEVVKEVKEKVEPKKVEPKKVEPKKVEPKKVEPKKVIKENLSIASLFQKFAVKGAKNRKVLAEKIINYLKEQGKSTNARGFPVLESKVLQQISSMLRDINSERGKNAGSWWSKYKVIETEELLKIEVKG